MVSSSSGSGPGNGANVGDAAVAAPISLEGYAQWTVAGRGAMAAVHRAQQTRLRRPVAIKELHPRMALDQSVMERFHREAQTIAGLAHQNIVHIYDVVEHEGRTLMVLEYVDGIDLAQLLSQVRRMPPEVAAVVALQAARALAYAHRRGVIHRDFKPSNLMLNRHGEIKLMDFGIARDAGGVDLTRPGDAIGTPAYMSPEQILGETVDQRSDIFSFGIVLYQMLTGQKPFVQDASGSVMQRIVQAKQVKARTLYPDIPFVLQRLVRRCLFKTPSKRVQSMDDVRVVLERAVRRMVPMDPHGFLVRYAQTLGYFSDTQAPVGQQPLAAKPESPADRDASTGIADHVRKLTVRVPVRLLPAVLQPVALCSAAILAVMLAWSGLVLGFGWGSNLGWLHLHAQPWADILVDGKPVGTTPMADPVGLAPGRHSVSFHHPTLGSVGRIVTITAGDHARVLVRMGADAGDSNNAGTGNSHD